MFCSTTNERQGLSGPWPTATRRWEFSLQDKGCKNERKKKPKYAAFNVANPSLLTERASIHPSHLHSWSSRARRSFGYFHFCSPVFCSLVCFNSLPLTLRKKTSRPTARDGHRYSCPTLVSYNGHNGPEAATIMSLLGVWKAWPSLWKAWATL